MVVSCVWGGEELYSPKIQSQIFTASVSLDCDFHKCSSGFLFVFPLGETGSLEVGLEYFHFHRSIAAVTSVVSDSVRPHRRQPTRLLHPWDSPGKNSGVGCHFLLQCMKVKKWKWSCSVVSDPQRSHGLQPTRLLHPWDFPGQSTGVGCHCLLQLGSGFPEGWRRKWQPTPVFLPGRSHGQRKLAGYSPWDHRVGHDWSEWTHTCTLETNATL